VLFEIGCHFRKVRFYGILLQMKKLYDFPFMNNCNYKMSQCVRSTVALCVVSFATLLIAKPSDSAMGCKAACPKDKGCVNIAAKCTPLQSKIASLYRIIGEDVWYGYKRTKFDFCGREAWIVEPSVAAAKGRPWTWTMQWAEAFVARTGVLDLLKRGYHHVTIDLFNTRMDENGIACAAAYQKFLVEKLGFAPKANLVGMSWGGFFSTRYAAAHPENVRRIYFDAPLMNFDGFGNPDYGRIGVWAQRKPVDGNWTVNPEMPVNKAEDIAKAKIPVLLIYGGSDNVVPPAQNCLLFMERFKAAGGELKVIAHNLFGHHPHGLDYDKTYQIADFFSSGD
jgi:pimeloyl-ACP methyl ester carboxylesterase